MDIANHRAVSVIKRALLVGWAVLMGGCVTLQPANYRPHYSNYSLLQSGSHCTAAVTEHSAVRADIEKLSMRAVSFGAVDEGGFSGFMAAALNEELAKGGIYAQPPQRTLKLSLEKNDLETPAGTGSATIAFTITVFDTQSQKEIAHIPLVTRREWKSSFVGVTAINVAVGQYSEAVAELNGKLFADPLFVQAIDCPTVSGR